MRKSIIFLTVGCLLLFAGTACTSDQKINLECDRIEWSLLEAMDYGTAALAVNQKSVGSFVRQKAASTAKSAQKLVGIHLKRLQGMGLKAHQKQGTTRVLELIVLANDVKAYCSETEKYIQTTSPQAREKHRQRILALYYKIKEKDRRTHQGMMI